MERWLFADPPTALAPLIRRALRALSDGLPAATAPGRDGALTTASEFSC
jgi:hypothetical protein